MVDVKIYVEFKEILMFNFVICYEESYVVDLDVEMVFFV